MSPYFHIALFISVICVAVERDKLDAADVALNIVPDLLGFTVGAMAIVIAFSAAPIFSVIAEDGHSESFFMKLAAGLVHFVIAQVVALALGVVVKLTKADWLEPIVLFFLLYAILVAFAAAMQLFYTAMIYNTGVKSQGDAAKASTIKMKPRRARTKGK